MPLVTADPEAPPYLTACMLRCGRLRFVKKKTQATFARLRPRMNPAPTASNAAAAQVPGSGTGAPTPSTAPVDMRSIFA